MCKEMECCWEYSIRISESLIVLCYLQSFKYNRRNLVDGVTAIYCAFWFSQQWKCIGQFVDIYYSIITHSRHWKNNMIDWLKAMKKVQIQFGARCYPTTCMIMDHAAILYPCSYLVLYYCLTWCLFATDRRWHANANYQLIAMTTSVWFWAMSYFYDKK